VVALVLDDFLADKSPNEVNSFVRQGAAIPRTFIDATRPKETKALLKFGRDSDWPLKITITSSLDGVNSVSASYAVGWEGCGASTESFWNKFVDAAPLDTF
jgi:hypothetical protein